MIKNERQYRITKARAEEFERALAELSSRSADHEEDGLWLKIQRDAITSQLDELREELNAFDELRAKGVDAVKINSLDELPHALIKARIAAGLTQRLLADRLGVKDQQIQRYEATDYAGASLASIQEVMRALDVNLSSSVLLPTTEATLSDVLKRLHKVGLPGVFVRSRLLPKTLSAHLRANFEGDATENGGSALAAAARVGRVFGWSPASILSNAHLRISDDAQAAARFKVPARTNQPFFAAYTVYAHYLALLLLQSTPHIASTRPIPLDAAVLRAAIGNHGEITLENILAYAWDELGIAVLPLNDAGAFHGACWRINGRNIIVLKQRTMSAARWIIDLLHEFHHLATKPTGDISIIEPDTLTKDAPGELVNEEQEATSFAGDVALDGRAEALVQKCVERAQGKLQRLKAAVPAVADEEGVPLDLLANYMAYRLSLQGENWWGVAQNLQQRTCHPWQVAREFVMKRADFDAVNPIDREILLQALSDIG